MVVRETDNLLILIFWMIYQFVRNGHGNETTYIANGESGVKCVV